MADDYNKKSLEDIAKLLNDIASPLQSVASAISNMIVEADSLNRAFGGGRVRIEEMNYAIKDSVSSINKLGGDISDVTTTMAGIAEGSRRSVIATEEQVSKLYASGQILAFFKRDNAGSKISSSLPVM
jgi:methyl-accepting chemotaxis protein